MLLAQANTSVGFQKKNMFHIKTGGFTWPMTTLVTRCQNILGCQNDPWGGITSKADICSASTWSNELGKKKITMVLFFSWIKQTNKKKVGSFWSYPVFGEKVVSKVNFSPLAIWETKRGGGIHLVWQEARQQVSIVTVRRILLLPHLIFNGDFCSQGVVSVPLFGEGQAILWPFVLGFQGASNFAGVSVGGTGSFEFLQGLKWEMAIRRYCWREASLENREMAKSRVEKKQKRWIIWSAATKKCSYHSAGWLCLDVELHHAKSWKNISWLIILKLNHLSSKSTLGDGASPSVKNPYHILCWRCPWRICPGQHSKEARPLFLGNKKKRQKKINDLFRSTIFSGPIWQNGSLLECLTEKDLT